jgi:hypothetical protein
MPTWDMLASFRRDFDKLSPAQQAAFRLAIAHFVTDMRVGAFRKGLRVKKMSGHGSVWELTWAPDGRATFEYGNEIVSGEQHVIWRRIGGHDIFGRP